MTEEQKIVTEDTEATEVEEDAAGAKTGDEEVTTDEANSTDENAKVDENNSESSSEEQNTEQKAEEESGDEKYVRLMAEFQNFKKRTAKEKKDIHAYANEKLVTDILPIFDNFERALITNAADDPEGYAKGMNLIFDQLKDALTKVGLKEIETLGTDFDPNKHNAVMHSESEEYEEGKVCTVLQKGYELNGKVIRPSMVAVAK